MRKTHLKLREKEIRISVRELIDQVLKRGDLLNRERIEEYARKHQVCPFELSLDLSLLTDVIICDYNYFFDPRIQLARYTSEITQPFVYLVDEAHNLVERSRGMFSAELEKKEFLELKRSVDKTTYPELHQCIDTLDVYLRDLRKSSFQEGQYQLALKEMPEELTDFLVDFLLTAEDLLQSVETFRFRDALQELYYRAAFFIKINQIRIESDAYAIIYRRSKSNLVVKQLCLDASEMLKSKIGQGISSIFFSATLSPEDYFINLLGGDDSDRYFQLPSPFPEENLAICLVDSISTRYRDRERTYDTIADYIAVYIEQKKGNYLVFFPSYQYLEQIYSRCRNRVADVEFIRQETRMSEADRDDFIREFTDDREKTLAGFVVMGGIFGESIDLPGDRLTGTAIVGVGLPQVNPERDLIRHYHDSRSKKGFHYSYTYPGMNKVLQAAGRLIRTETDRGSLLLIDDRFSSNLYRSLYPSQWKTIHRIADPENLEKVLSNFWKNAVE